MYSFNIRKQQFWHFFSNFNHENKYTFWTIHYNTPFFKKDIYLRLKCNQKSLKMLKIERDRIFFTEKVKYLIFLIFFSVNNNFPSLTHPIVSKLQAFQINGVSCTPKVFYVIFMM